ncbi:hypothetical protein DPV78_002290 [Talaromyces pinophilus]|nr:hypothetical protein DPV78_002290 [Talaromyces pinophilus]
MEETNDPKSRESYDRREVEGQKTVAGGKTLRLHKVVPVRRSYGQSELLSGGGETDRLQLHLNVFPAAAEEIDVKLQSQMLPAQITSVLLGAYTSNRTR